MNPKKPDFIIIGAAKSGTTSLHHYLKRHPSVFMCTPKEPSYFAFEERYARGTDWYFSLFEDVEKGQIAGEASTNYSNWPLYSHVAERMLALLPDIKLIYIMRHPVDRAYSHYLQLIDNQREKDKDYKFTDTFEKHIEKDDSVLQSSLYMCQINQYLKYYHRDQFLFLLFDDFIAHPQQTLNEVFNFLKIDTRINLQTHDSSRENRVQTKDDWLIRSKLTEPLRALPGAQWLADQLSQNTRDRIVNLLSALPKRQQIESEFIPPPMQEETRAELLQYFTIPNQELADFLGKDLSHWNQ